MTHSIVFPAAERFIRPPHGPVPVAACAHLTWMTHGTTARARAIGAFDATEAAWLAESIGLLALFGVTRFIVELEGVPASAEVDAAVDSMRLSAASITAQVVPAAG